MQPYTTEGHSTMLNCTDCDIRVAAHARQIANVNEGAWIREGSGDHIRLSLRSRLGTLLIRFGTRLTASRPNTPVNAIVPAGEWT
jgi:hypothetical protein